MDFKEARGIINELYGKSWETIKARGLGVVEEAIHIMYSQRTETLGDRDRTNWLSLKLRFELEEG